MIDLCVEDYCQECTEFEPLVNKLYNNNNANTIIICEHHNKCEQIALCIRKEIKGELDNDDCGSY